MSRKSQFSRWVHLVHLTEEMERLQKDNRVSVAQLRVYLASVQETFGDLEDPVAEFPSFTLRRFCRQLSLCLESVEQGRGGSNSSIELRPRANHR